MNSTYASASQSDIPVIARRLHLVEATVDSRRPPVGASAGALAAGLASGFVLAAVGAVMGGGDPSTSLRLASLCAVASLVARVRGRRHDRRSPAPALAPRGAGLPVARGPQIRRAA